MKNIAKVKVDSVKIIVAMARKAIDITDIVRNIGGRFTLCKGLKQKNFMLRTKYAGQLANFLGVDVTALLADEDTNDSAE